MPAKLARTACMRLELMWGAQPSVWGTSDGKGHSLVYYFGLPDGWDPAMLDNQAALALWQRFVHDGREADGWGSHHSPPASMLLAL